MRLLQLLLFGLTLNALSGCTLKKELARVTSIDPADRKVFRVIEGGLGDKPPSRIVITFDRSLDANTANNQAVQVIMFPDNGQPNAPVAGTVTYDEASNSVEFAPNQPFQWGVISGFRYQITVRGDGPDPVLDVDGLALDGDGDGKSGGNFVADFTILFIVA